MVLCLDLMVECSRRLQLCASWASVNYLGLDVNSLPSCGHYSIVSHFVGLKLIPRRKGIVYRMRQNLFGRDKIFSPELSLMINCSSWKRVVSISDQIIRQANLLEDLL